MGKAVRKAGQQRILVMYYTNIRGNYQVWSDLTPQIRPTHLKRSKPQRDRMRYLPHRID